MYIYIYHRIYIYIYTYIKINMHAPGNCLAFNVCMVILSTQKHERTCFSNHHITRGTTSKNLDHFVYKKHERTCFSTHHIARGTT